MSTTTSRPPVVPTSKVSGRIPTVMAAEVAAEICAGSIGIDSVPIRTAPSTIEPERRFMAGDPMNPATKELTGRVNSSRGEAHCWSMPSRRTATRSPIVIAST